MTNLELAITAFLDYLQYFDFLALPAKKGNFTVYSIFTAAQARELVKDNIVKTLWKLDGQELRWRGGMINKMPWRDMPTPQKQLTFLKRWNEFEYHAGNRSAAQEKAVCEGLNRIKWLNQQWTHTGTEKPISEQYNPDIVAENGYTVEVKGFNSPVFKH